MGRRSAKEDKSIYQLCREAKSLTREHASELMEFISPEKIEKIENGRVNIQPDDVVVMSRCYAAPELCAHYCSNECAIGRDRIPQAQVKDLAQITVETLNALNRLSREKDRLLEIAEDGRVRPDERADFVRIKADLDKISLSVRNLQLWLDKAILEGRMEELGDA